MSQSNEGTGVFVNNLKRIMNEKNIIQADIARGLNVSTTMVSLWVRGKNYPRIGMMQRLADFLSVPIADLTSPPRNNEDPELARFNDMVKSLSDEDKKLLLLTMQRLIDGRK